MHPDLPYHHCQATSEHYRYFEFSKDSRLAAPRLLIAANVECCLTYYA